MLPYVELLICPFHGRMATSFYNLIPESFYVFNYNFYVVVEMLFSQPHLCACFLCECNCKKRQKSKFTVNAIASDFPGRIFEQQSALFILEA